MAKVTDQDLTHYLIPTLERLVETRSDYNAARLRPHSRSNTPRSPLLQAWRSILAAIVASWRALTDTQRAWYRTNAPAYYKSGYTWYISLNLKAAAQRANWQDGW